MMLLSKMNNFLFLLLISVIAAGCSVTNELYVINKSEDITTVKIIFSKPIEQIQKIPQIFMLAYVDSIVTISGKTKEILPGRLDYAIIDQNTVSFIVPPGSTVLIGKATNNILYADSIRFTSPNSDYIFTTETLAENVTRSGGFFSPFQYTYIIENKAGLKNP